MVGGSHRVYPPGLHPREARVNSEIQDCDFLGGPAGADIELGNLTVEGQILGIKEKKTAGFLDQTRTLDVGRAFGHSASLFPSSVFIPLLMGLSSSYNFEEVQCLLPNSTIRISKSPSAHPTLLSPPHILVSIDFH